MTKLCSFFYSTGGLGKAKGNRGIKRSTICFIIFRIPCGGDHGDEWIQRPRDGDGDDDEDFCYAVYADWNSQLTFRQAEKNCTAQVPIYQE